MIEYGCDSMNNHKHEHLAGERPGSHTNQMILMIVFLGVWIIDSFFLRLTTFLFNWSYVWLNVVIGMVVLGCSIYFMNASHKDLFDTEEQGLATKGVFARVRNPMYLGTVLFYLGLIVLTVSLAALIVWLVTCVYYNMLANYEEMRLQEKFGEEFVEYKKSVRKWIPV
jgi:protein-S-isoprenylcysteine O-methyltransferase Ste14